jgi:hypothetical protein
MEEEFNLKFQAGPMMVRAKKLTQAELGGKMGVQRSDTRD